MSDNGAGNDRRNGVFGTLTTAIGRLSPEFLGLVMLVGMMFLGLVWLFDRQSGSRERVLAPLIEACALSVPIEVVKMLPRPDGAPREENTQRLIAALDDLKQRVLDHDRSIHVQLEDFQRSMNIVRTEVARPPAAQRLVGPR